MCPQINIFALHSWHVLAARTKSLVNQGSQSVQPGLALEVVNALQLNMTRLCGRAARNSAGLCKQNHTCLVQMTSILHQLAHAPVACAARSFTWQASSPSLLWDT